AGLPTWWAGHRPWLLRAFGTPRAPVACPATMRIGIPKESEPGERRVGLVPDVVAKLVGEGLQVAVEAGAGEAALIPDALFADAGATVADDPAQVWDADVVVKLAPPTDHELQRVGPHSVIIGLLRPYTDARAMAALRDAGATALALETLPRISRAQSIDALSSQSNVAGYRAALIAAQELGRFVPAMMTAAGSVPPATVLVLGAGVAGLQAIATARRLGASVVGFDVRPEVQEQVRSLGAKWLLLEGLGEGGGEGGYARALTEEEQVRQRELLAKAMEVVGVDAAITTALIPGRPAPLLITEDAVKRMRPGGVVVDLAAEAGGNCELSEPGRTVVRHDVRIAAPLNLPSSLPEHASQLFARNVQALLDLLVRDRTLHLDLEDEVVTGLCVVREGRIRNERVRALVEDAAPSREGGPS
ncbi:MAG TPA: Re/Si-specific NAD(P)(+) transhydrogenase subunit alpha, partial [Acidimicrobiales bacterium]|nr:Re/Si-specific NAD(P)(+) transhydrogenase subunit alpha [Acidimicrobiales bacterium]